MANYPKDRFDEQPDDIARIGAHRGPKRRGRGWIALAWALLATGVLIFGGLFGLSQYLDDDLGIPFFASPQEPTATPTPEETVEPITDPSTIDPAREISIDVLNGTEHNGSHTSVLEELRTAGWPMGSAAPASARDIEDTYVYYSNPDDEDIASGLIAAIGIGEIRLIEPDIFPAAQLTLVIGSDYFSPTTPDSEPTAEPTE